VKLVTYRTHSGALRPGFVSDARVFDVAALLGIESTSVRQLLEDHGSDLPGLARTLEAATDAGGACRGWLSEARLGPPVTDPAKVLCIGINYRDHAAETGRELPKNPDVFNKFASSLVGAADDLAISDVSPKLDYEGELAVVIGQPCRNVTAGEAVDRIAGAMVMNDITARDLQFNATQWLPGKAVDKSSPCGPALVTLDEVGDLQNLNLCTRVNGVEVQRSHTSMMIFPVATIVAYISKFLELSPGDVITTGTPDGIGSRRDPPSFLSPGDVVEVEIDRLGVLHNTVA